MPAAAIGEGRSGIRDEAPDERDRIARRAYELYLERGGSDGRDFDDWLAAERELASGPARERPE